MFSFCSSFCCIFYFEHCSFLISLLARNLWWCLGPWTWPPEDTIFPRSCCQQYYWTCLVWIREESATQFSHRIPICFVSSGCNRKKLGQEHIVSVEICQGRCCPTHCCWLRFLPSSILLVFFQGSRRFQSISYSIWCKGMTWCKYVCSIMKRPKKNSQKNFLMW